MWTIIFLLVVVILRVSQSTVFVNQWGTEFLVAFAPNYAQSGRCSLHITARGDCSVLVENKLFNIATWIYIEAMSSATLDLTPKLQYTAEDVAQDKAVYVRSTGEISVYAVSSEARSAGATLVLPVRALGSEYVLATYPTEHNNVFLVAAVHDNTAVKVKVRLDSDSGRCLKGAALDGNEIPQTLHSGQVWGGLCTSASFLGSVVTSDKPVVVIAAVACGKVPSAALYCDHMTEMMVPTEDLGSNYVMSEVTATIDVTHVVISLFDGNSVWVSFGDSQSLNYGEFVEYGLEADSEGSAGPVCVTSDKPVLVLAFAKGSEESGAGLGDPSMAVVPPVDRWADDYLISLEGDPGQILERQVSVVIHSGHASGLLISETQQPSFKGTTNCDYKEGHVLLNGTSHWLHHSTAGTQFGAVQYASGSGFGMATLAGMMFIDKNHSLPTTDTAFLSYTRPSPQDTTRPSGSRDATTPTSSKDTTTHSDLNCSTLESTNSRNISTPNATLAITSASSAWKWKFACRCLCTVYTKTPRDASPAKVAKKEAERVKRELTVDRRRLSKTIRTKTSAPDDRPSATGIGFVGLAFLVMTGALILLADVTAFFGVGRQARTRVRGRR